MSTATLVPETATVGGDGPWATVVAVGRPTLFRDAFMRMRFADGFSHSRSLAFLLSLVLVQAIIALVGLASARGDTRVAQMIVQSIESAVPGPAGQVLTSAVTQANQAGSSGRSLALVLGSIGLLVSTTTAMGQLERGLNRLYGVERDRPFAKKYGLALLLALTAGTLTGFAFAAVGFGSAIGDSLRSHTIRDVWSVARWPAALLFMMTVTTLLFRWSPRRKQPGWTWLALGSSVSVFLWFVVTASMSAVFRVSPSFGETYGPLAGIVALQVWCLLSAMAVFLGGAVSAQLEAERAGRSEPQDRSKVARSEPDAADVGPLRTPAVGVS